MKEQMGSLMTQLEHQMQVAQEKMIRVMEQDANRADMIQRCLDTVSRTEESLIAMKRKGAAGDVKKKLMGDNQAQPMFGGAFIPDDEGENIKG